MVVNKLVKTKEDDSQPMFKAVVANPPYQKQTGVQTSTDIYQFFQQIASSVSEHTSLVYPASWKKDVSEQDTFLGRFLVDGGVYTVYSYIGLQLFENHIERNFALTIVACKKVLSNKNGKKLLSYYSGPIHTEEEPVLRPVDVWNTRKDTRILFDRTKNYGTYLKGLVKDLSLVSNLKDSAIDYSLEKTNEFNNSIFAKREPGVGSKGEMLYIKAEDQKRTLKDNDYLDAYKIIMQSSPLGRINHWYSRVEKRGTIRSEVLNPDTSFGKTFVLLGSFKKKEDAYNFSSYINTNFCLRLGSLDVKKSGFGRFIPDFNDYSNQNPLFSNDDVLKNSEYSHYIGKTLEERLYTYFGLQKDEINIIEERKSVR